MSPMPEPDVLALIAEVLDAAAGSGDPTVNARLVVLEEALGLSRDVERYDRYPSEPDASAYLTALRSRFVPVEKVRKLVDVVRQGLNAPSGMSICSCRVRGMPAPVCWYCKVREALTALPEENRRTHIALPAQPSKEGA